MAHLTTGDVHTVFWLGDLREGDNLKGLGVDGRYFSNGFSRSGMRSLDSGLEKERY